MLCIDPCIESYFTAGNITCSSQEDFVMLSTLVLITPVHCSADLLFYHLVARQRSQN